MASFTDQLVAFNPYVSQIPVDDYVRVGLIKQQQYDQGVQKVQSYIDSVAGMEVVKAEHKDYLNKTVNNLKGEVSKIISRDFANQQLVSSVGNLSSKMASDPILQNAQVSTQRYKSGLSSMKKAQAEGKSSPSNEWVYQKQVSDWLGDGDITTSFNGEYTPFTDVNKKVLAVIKDLDPTSTLEQIPYKRGANGEILQDSSGKPIIDMAMMEKSVKGVTPERIEAAIRASLDPNDMRQLQIDGTYNFRNYDRSALKKMTDESYNNRLDKINSAIQGLTVSRQTNINDPDYIKRVDAQIALLGDRARKYQENYKADINNINKDPEGYKASAHMQSWITQFGDGFAYSENSLKYEDNPYFKAALDLREVDITYQKFLWEQQMDVANLAIKKEELEISRLKAQADAKKAKEGESPFIGLMDPIREPVDTKTLGKISTSTFVDETENMSTIVDNQKMALLAQIRPDLVQVVRNADGLSARYEYNVAGKNPETVKGEAEASILKIKDSYDKDPNSVDDASRTYFDNLGTAGIRVQNRKTAMAKVTYDVNRDVGTIQPLLSKISPITIKDDKGQPVTISPEQMLDFTTRVKGMDIFKGGSYNEETVNRIFTSPKDRLMARVYLNPNPFATERMTGEQKQLRARLGEVFVNVNAASRGLADQRKQYTDNAVREVVSATQPVSFTVEAFKAEDRNRIQSVVSRLFNTIVGADKSNASPRYDKKDVSEMLTGKNSGNTSYALRSLGGDQYALTLSNTGVTNEPIEIDITKAQASDLFGQNKFLDDFQAIREAMNLTRSTGRVTTDVQGKGIESAFTLRNPNITQYGVKYHVEDPLKNGGLQIRAYIYDKSSKEWNEKPIRFGQLLNEAQITRALGSLTDAEIKNILGK